MTRDFNKQRRNDDYRPFRGTSSNRYGNTRPAQSNTGRPNREDVSSNRYGDTRPSQPNNRVRLSREVVDRGWENGASRQHPDYRPRSTGGQPQRNNWKRNQNSESTSYNNAPDQRRTYGHRQDNRDNNFERNGERNFERRDGQRFERRDNNFERRDGQRFERRDNNFERRDGQRFERRDNNFERRDGQRFERNGGERNFERRDNNFERRDGQRFERHGERQPGTHHSSSWSQQPDSEKSYQRPGRFNENRETFGKYNQGNPERKAGRNTSASNDYIPSRERRGEARHAREERKFVGEKPVRKRAPFRKTERDESAPLHPRYLSRPHVHNRLNTEAEVETNETQLPGQFEGDYEQFNEEQTKSEGGEKRTGRARSYERRQATRSTERHVTRLPDGRVIKGSRPAQRKNAQFWTDINENTGELMENVHVPETSVEEQGEGARRQSRQPASAVRRKKGGARSLTPVTKPSQKGFKWTK